MILRTLPHGDAFVKIEHGGIVDLIRIDHVALNVRNLQRSFDWYHRVFGFLVVHKWEAIWMIGSAATRLGLFERPNAMPIDHQELDKRLAVTHVAFLTDHSRLESAKAELTALGEPFQVEDLGIARSVLISDPDGHQIEITAYNPIESPDASDHAR